MEISISIVEVGAQIIRLSASGTNASWQTFAPVNDSFVNDSLLQTKPLFGQPLS